MNPHLSIFRLGNKRGHKGGKRRFTNPQEIAMRKEKEEREKEWRRKRGEITESDEEDEDNSQDEESSDDEQKKLEKLDALRKANAQKKPEDDVDDEEEEEDEDEEPLIEICNPNRVQPKVKKDVNALANEKVVLSRKEKEQLASQKSKTKEAREDLARLALVRQKREEAAKKRDEQAKQQATTSKTVAKK